MEWYRRGIQLSFRIEPAGFALAAAYALLCWAARQVSMDQFYLPAGIRVAALLLFPPRMWPYLFLGEYAYFAHMRVPMIERYGVAWVILSSAFLMPAVALIVRWHRRMMAARTDAWFISAAITCAATATLLNLCFSPFLRLVTASATTTCSASVDGRESFCPWRTPGHPISVAK